MGLFGFGKKKKESSANDEYRSRSLRDMKAPPSLSDAMRANVKHDDRIIVGSDLYELVSVDNHVRSHLYVSNPPVGKKVGLSEDGQYIVYGGKRIASIEGKTDTILEHFSNGGLVVAIPGNPSGTDMPLSIAYYKKASTGNVFRVELPLVVSMNSETSYFSYDEFEGMEINKLYNSYFDDDEEFRYILYHQDHEICTLSAAKSERIDDLLKDGFQLSDGKVVSVSGTDNSVRFSIKIVLVFMK